MSHFASEVIFWRPTGCSPNCFLFISATLQHCSNETSLADGRFWIYCDELSVFPYAAFSQQAYSSTWWDILCPVEQVVNKWLTSLCSLWMWSTIKKTKKRRSWLRHIKSEQEVVEMIVGSLVFVYKISKVSKRLNTWTWKTTALLSLPSLLIGQSENVDYLKQLCFGSSKLDLNVLAAQTPRQELVSQYKYKSFFK